MRQIFLAVTLVLKDDSELTPQQVQCEVQTNLEQHMDEFGIQNVYTTKGVELEYPDVNPDRRK